MRHNTHRCKFEISEFFDGNTVLLKQLANSNKSKYFDKTLLNIMKDKEIFKDIYNKIKSKEYKKEHYDLIDNYIKIKDPEKYDKLNKYHVHYYLYSDRPEFEIIKILSKIIYQIKTN
ncbi:hypothetical protein BCR32DRAFT_239489 [Anaeromyces robustus]|uniref:Uncharacterized protein n=1 Tax=Anaeromyces robustus TaxID=1754192 RepID=A0A1Y1XR53_9FUNG|nr:hypothetical protein BCR32DRAFT_239489 [Anaeromyces robustus]|eukprot:ORX88213.1 hypothetical protein BCR32DRAFT_239489 [Anaeromyces robustus]